MTGLLVDVNDVFVETTGYSRENSIGFSAVDIGWVTAAERNSMIKILETEGRVKNLEVTVNCADGSQRFCLYSGEIIEFGGKRRFAFNRHGYHRQKTGGGSTAQERRSPIRNNETNSQCTFFNSMQGIMAQGDSIILAKDRNR